MTAKEIVRKYLEDNGYDGLHNDGECGCELNDLFPCSETPECCKPGHKIECDHKCSENSFCIGPEKNMTECPNDL